MSDAEKEKGTAAFKSKDYKTAVECYTQAISYDPFNHILFSNRSAALLSWKQYSRAIKDAQRCIDLSPKWAKGYYRLGNAYLKLKDYTQACDALRSGLKIDRKNALLKKAYAQALAKCSTTKKENHHSKK